MTRPALPCKFCKKPASRAVSDAARPGAGSCSRSRRPGSWRSGGRTPWSVTWETWRPQVVAKGPLAVRLAKLAVQAGYETDQRTGLLIERLAQAILLTSEDKREGTPAFLEEREPDFKGR